MSCGISSDFSLLFRTRRQIAHALLTRPPLTVFLLSVRLECVMHAASVHPEPGSNSLKNYNLTSLSSVNPFLEVTILASSYFLSLLNVFSLTRFRLHTLVLHLHVLFEILLFNFQGSMLVPRGFSRGQLDYYSTLFSVCQPLFESFFNFFEVFPKKACRILSITQALDYYTTLVFICQEVFSIFLRFFASFYVFSEISFYFLSKRHFFFV